jgi:hypothetical protein
LEPSTLDWFYTGYAVVSERDFLGVRVILGEPTDEANVTRLQPGVWSAQRFTSKRPLATVGAAP